MLDCYEMVCMYGASSDTLFRDWADRRHQIWMGIED